MTPLDETGFRNAVTLLAGLDPAFAAAVAAHGVPPFWHRPPGFATLSLFIVEQQVSLASAKAVFERVFDLLGSFTPDRILAVTPDDLGRAGLTRQKQRYLINLSQLVVDGTFDIEALAHLDDDAARANLVGLLGVGPWTADVYLLSALRRPDLWPIGDRALQVGVGELLGLGAPPTGQTLDEIGERWRPHRSTAARLVWHRYLEVRGRRETAVRGIG